MKYVQGNRIRGAVLRVARGACDSRWKSLVDKPSEMIFGYRVATNLTEI